MVLNKKQLKNGFSLVEILIVSAIMLVVFGGLLISFRYSLELISHSRAKLTALTLANDGMEYIRSLSYNAVGTVSGIPAGLIPQVSTTTLNGIVFTKRVLVEYIDDDADGLGGADSNGITTDYKQAKVTLLWTLRGVTKSVFFVSNIIPQSIETDVGGGTVRINVFDATNTPLPGATVRLINSTTTPTIDVTRTSDASGIALFGGAPAGAEYEVMVTAPGYSIDKTYRATTTLPNSSKLPFAVIESLTATQNFFIDELSDVRLTALSSRITGDFTDDFSGSANIATSTNTTVVSGKLELSGAPGSYLSGITYLSGIIPSSLAVWDILYLAGINTVNTNILARLYTGTSSPYTLIPDSDLSNNSSGFSLGSVDIGMLDPILYSSVTVGIELVTTNSNETPQLDTIVLGYIESQTPFANRPITLTGNKVIGSLADTSPVYKTVISTTTNAQGKVTLGQIEYNLYTFVSSGYDIAEICSPTGLDVRAGSSVDLNLLLRPDTADSMRVIVTTAGGTPVPQASVTLAEGVFSQTLVTSSCGQVFFSGLSPAPNYTLDITAAGFTTQNLTNVDVTGDVVTGITL